MSVKASKVAAAIGRHRPALQRLNANVGVPSHASVATPARPQGSTRAAIRATPAGNTPAYRKPIREPNSLGPIHRGAVKE